MEGGLIGLLEEGDIIEIDIPKRTINARLTEEEIAARRANWKEPEAKIKTGIMRRYAKQVSSAAEGAVLEQR